MTEAHPVAATFLKNAVEQGAKLIVADPRRQPLVDHADLFAQIKVGSDIAFLNGIMRVLIEEDLYDREFVNQNCTGFEEFRAHILATPLEKRREDFGRQRSADSGDCAPPGCGKTLYALLYAGHYGTYLRQKQRPIGGKPANAARQYGRGMRRRESITRGQNNGGACDMGAFCRMYFTAIKK